MLFVPGSCQWCPLDGLFGMWSAFQIGIALRAAAEMTYLEGGILAAMHGTLGLM